MCRGDETVQDVVDVVWTDCGVSWMKLLLRSAGNLQTLGRVPSNEMNETNNSLMNEQNQ